MRTTAIESTTKMVSPTVPTLSVATRFAKGVRVYMEEYRLANKATVRTNERRSLPGLRALYVPFAPKRCSNVRTL